MLEEKALVVRSNLCLTKNMQVAGEKWVKCNKGKDWPAISSLRVRSTANQTYGAIGHLVIRGGRKVRESCSGWELICAGDQKLVQAVNVMQYKPNSHENENG